MPTDSHHSMPTLNAYFKAAQAHLPEDHLAYFFGGAGSETTLRANQSDFENICIRPRILRDLRGGGTQVTVLNTPMSAPLLIAPIAYQKLLCPQGECATAQAAAAQDLPMILSSQSATPMSDVATAGEGNTSWFQLYWQADRSTTMVLAERAMRAGYSALVLTVDAPVNGIRDREIETGFALPDGISAVNLAGLPRPQFAPLAADETLLFDRVAHCAPTWEDVAWLCESVGLPVVIKGVLSPEDALLAVQSGASALVVSNHGGRVLDGVPSAINALPEVVQAVGDAIPVFMDSGIRRGTDIFKALALGASAVLVGRPVLCGLAVAGAQGASHVLRMLKDELEAAMMLAGCRTIADITPEHVYLKR
ncbi:4-hydroxymandelate oxidase [Pacificibacter maritimus]|uniref:4-hydroxymandelate oxidase n=1 Tax=Pacificibacter maritimus TaxID=762213 RepID=A0A3N4UJ32_9RHOB|nr:alpha-hydroxy acid oxidase [Pacificibacter maritimus]RPE67341.1 4-hydroxymandelate oxidase [Pacificibacter maritimus]